MLRFLTKGVVWRNIEDDILKVAVDRYGENQWDRIASLFHRKSAKQCKARWHELLLPNIKKSEWNLEEKIEKTESNNESEDKCKRLKLEEIDLNTECKNDHLQSVDMEEHDHGTLSEVKSRLSGTQNENTNRKDCNKQLIEGGGLAALQKRRELRARALEMKAKNRRKKDVDPSKDMKIEKRPTSVKEDLNVHSCVERRNLPLPLNINENILRNVHPGDPPLNDLQKAEELIKHEMLIMLHHDSAVSETQHGTTPVLESNQTNQHSIDKRNVHLHYLQQHPMEKISREDIDSARNLLHAEMDIVKHGMSHGDVSIETFSHIWEECYSQVLYLPSQNRYTRANLVSKKDRMESLKHKLETNRTHMSKESKSAAKLQKHLEIQLNGYQSQSQDLLKEISRLHKKIEKTHVELQTLEHLHHHETEAIHKRTETLTDDVVHQTDRQKKLLLRYNNLQENYVKSRMTQK
ncbi:CDC5 cell division cycle 5-like protein [Mactra antiquata]